MLGQLKTADKSTEITAIPELIKTLDLQGAIVTSDASGAWISPSGETTAASAKTMPRKIWQSCATWRPTC